MDILDGNDTLVTANMWLGPDDFSSMTPDEYKSLCLDNTRHHGAADLVELSFATVSATLTYGDKEDHIHNMILSEAEEFHH